MGSSPTAGHNSEQCEEATVRPRKSRVKWMQVPTRNQLDAAFPTIVRYCGLGLTFVLVGFSLAGYVAEAAPGFVAAAGMLLYKTVKGAAENGHG